MCWLSDLYSAAKRNFLPGTINSKSNAAFTHGSGRRQTGCNFSGRERDSELEARLAENTVDSNGGLQGHPKIIYNFLPSAATDVTWFLNISRKHGQDAFLLSLSVMEVNKQSEVWQRLFH